jgi:hypothetical protein
MPTRYKIHPGIGIARLGNSPSDFCITPEEPAALPLACDSEGNPLRSPDGETELRVDTFKDAEGRIKRQAARFQVYVYDDESPEGRPLQIGDPVSGGGNQGHLVDIQWRVHLANKKASWYQFRQLEGEHGYAGDHPRRNADVTAAAARQQLIIDAGPRVVDRTARRTAQFDNRADGMYAPTFPPELRPHSIDTLGELKTDEDGRLLVLGGYGNSGTYLFEEFGQPRIDTYANTDGWFDDISDGPVMARLIMYSENVGATKFVDVEYPAWVVVGYPAYVPQILDMVTMDDTMRDMFVREFAYRTDLYGEADTFAEPQHIHPTDREALLHWKAGRLEWNDGYKPWFYRDVWPILFRPDEFSFLTNILGQSNYPHNQSQRGNFDPVRLGASPGITKSALDTCDREAIAEHMSGRLFVDTFQPALDLDRRLIMASQEADAPEAASVQEETQKLQEVVAAFAASVASGDLPHDVPGFLRAWRLTQSAPGYSEAKERLQQAFDEVAGSLPTTPEEGTVSRPLRVLLSEHLVKYETGALLEETRRRRVAVATSDPYRDYRSYLFDLLRKSGEENRFRIETEPSSRIHGLPLMPLLAGDNPISNSLPSKFFRLTDLQHFILRQWARGLFFNEVEEGWPHPANPYMPYADWVNRTGRDLDRGVLSNVLGGSFCPGAELGWIMRNPAIYLEPYRVKADPAFYSFQTTAAQANANRASPADLDESFDIGSPLNQDDDFDQGMQPGDLTKHMSVPWQSDFNECSTQTIDVTYELWNQIFPSSEGDSLMQREQKVWETLWWPAHRPLQGYELSVVAGKPSYEWVDWSLGIPQTKAGDLEMVTQWSGLGFVLLNPYAKPADLRPSEVPLLKKYVFVERNRGSEGES